MPKLPVDNSFLDLSDYGRPLGKAIANSLKSTGITPIHVTIWFILAGLIAVLFILTGHYWLAALFLIIKSILDAADGELARVKQTPSYTGRYFDSIADILLNFIILIAICHITDGNILLALLAFISIQFQGTLYNYYYVILRNKYHGDETSRIFENETPLAMPREEQKTVDFLFTIYKILYGLFDKSIYVLDPNAPQGHAFPNWLMTIVSTMGLGFQLLLISIMLVSGLAHYIVPFFIFYSLAVLVLIAIRKLL
ncbi:MAG: CDP-alcohol phosphatidyltransferase family protein [Bacteroidia bacterium]|nr:CDP-alcohol phosphatidyltransferase family protein [Bacteroidia bacterium]